MKKWKILGWSLLSLLLLIQLIPVDRNAPLFETEKDFLHLAEASPEMATLLKNACYDCHSFETQYPWYSKLAPISFIMADHIEEGRSHLNFSIWGDYGSKKKDHKLEECAEEVEHGEMPLKGYTLFHGNARLSKEERKQIQDFFSGLRM